MPWCLDALLSPVLIIDGYNVVHAAAKVEPRLGTLSVGRLCAMLAAGRYGGGPVLVVCDGTGGRAGVDESLTHPDAPIRVMFAGPGKDADTAIERLLEDLERAGKARGCTVVSSDRRVQAAAVGVRGGGCRRMSSEALVRELLDDLGRAEAKRRAAGGDRPAAAAREGLDEDATAYWLGQFGMEGDGRRAREAAPASGPPAPAPERVAGSSPAAQPDEDEELLREAMQEWGDGIDPADLDTGKWLDEPPSPDRPPSK